MSKKQKKLYARYGFTDLVIDAKINISKYVVINAYNSVKTVGEVELSLIGFEDENGVECNEDGTEL